MAEDYDLSNREKLATKKKLESLKLEIELLKNQLVEEENMAKRRSHKPSTPSIRQ